MKVIYRIIIISLLALLLLSQAPVKKKEKIELVIQNGHSGKVNGILLTKDEKKLISYSADGAIKIWDIKTGKLFKNLEGHTTYIKGVQLTQKEDKLISFSYDGIIKIWDFENGKLLNNLVGRTCVGYGIRITKDENILISYCQYSSKIQLWDINTGKLLRTFEHNLFVNGIQLTKDETKLISYSWSPLNTSLNNNNTIKIWDMDTGKLLRTLKGHSYDTKGIQLTKNEQILISYSKERFIKIWDTNSGRLLKSLEHFDEVNGIRLSNDETKLFSYSNDGTIKIWDISSVRVNNNMPLQKNLEVESDWVFDIQFAKNNKLISLTTNNSIQIWNMNTGKLFKTLKGHSNEINGILVTADATKIISYSKDKTVRIWDINTGKLLKIVEHDDEVNGIQLMKDENKLISFSGRSVFKSYYNAIKIWDISSIDANNSVSVLNTFEGHTEQDSEFILMKDKGRLITGSGDNTIKIYDIENGNLLTTLQGNWVQLTKDENKLISYSATNSIEIWNIQNGKLLKTLKGHTDKIYGVKLSKDEKRLISWSADNRIMIWNLEDEKLLHTLVEHKYIKLIQLTNDELKIILNLEHDKTIKIWDINTGKLLKTLKGHDGWISGIHLTKDTKKIISYSYDNTIKIWNVEDGKLFKSLEGHTSWIEEIQQIENEKKLISYSLDNMIKIWDLQDGKLLKTLKGHANRVNGNHITKDEKKLISYSYDNTIKIWDLQEGKLLKTLKGHANTINGIQLTKDEKKLISYSDDKTIKVWDIEEGKILKSFEGHTSWIKEIQQIEDEKKIISNSYDNTIKIWDMETGKCLQTLNHYSSSIREIIVKKTSTNSNFLLSISNDSSFRYWDIESGKLLVTQLLFKDGEGLVYTPDGRFDYTDPKVKDYVSYRKGNEFIELCDIHDEKYTKGLLQLVLNGKLKAEDSAGFEKSFENLPAIKYQYPSETKKIASKEEYTEVGFEVSDTGQGIREVKVLVNGIAVNVPEEQLNELKNGNSANEFRVKLPLAAVADNRIEIKAYNNEGGVRSITVHLGRSGEGLAVKKPNLYLLSVGVGKYDKKPLTYTVKDATVLAETLKVKTKDLYEKQNVVILTDEKASRELILKELDKIVKESKPEDTVILYFSGHGSVANKQNGNSLYYYLPFGFDWNAKPKIERTATEQGLDMELLAKQIKSMFSRKVVIILDTCFSGSAAEILAMTKDGGEELQAFKEQQEKLSNGTGRYFFASSAEDEVSREFAELGHGIFTKAFLNTLDDSAGDTDKDNHLSVLEVNNRLNQHFEILSKKYLKQETQSPICTPMGRDSFSSKRNDFPLVKAQ